MKVNDFVNKAIEIATKHKTLYVMGCFGAPLNATNKKRGLRVHVATAFFVPKPHTPFQWEAQNTRAEFTRKAALLREAITAKVCSGVLHVVLPKLENVPAKEPTRVIEIE